MFSDLSLGRTLPILSENDMLISLLFRENTDENSLFPSRSDDRVSSCFGVVELLSSLSFSRYGIAPLGFISPLSNLFEIGLLLILIAFMGSMPKD